MTPSSALPPQQLTFLEGNGLENNKDHLPRWTDETVISVRQSNRQGEN